MTRSLPLLLAVTLAGPAFGGDLPYIGKWDCQVAVFTFTGTTYQPGEGEAELPIQRIDLLENNSFILTMPDDYQVSLSNVTETSMSWLSGASGDSFDCTRIE